MLLSIINQQKKNFEGKSLENNSFHDITNRSVVIIGIIDIILIAVALYISYICNNYRFKLGSVLVAVLFAPLYIIYRLIYRLIRRKCFKYTSL
jgi:uncharacterized membrane protein